MSLGYDRDSILRKEGETWRDEDEAKGVAIDETTEEASDVTIVAGNVASRKSSDKHRRDAACRTARERKISHAARRIDGDRKTSHADRDEEVPLKCAVCERREDVCG